MAVKTGELEAEVIDAVCARVRERLPGRQAGPCESFVRQYYQWVPLDDLADRDPLDLYGAAVAHWNLTQQREPGEVKVHVYNPDFEQHGWRSPHTVIELVTDDMPFLVDSVTMELGRQGYGIDLVIHPVMKIRRDGNGRLVDVLELTSDDERGVPESILHAEVLRQPDKERLAELAGGIKRVLGDVDAAVHAWEPMRERMQAIAAELAERRPSIDEDELQEVKAFLGWLTDHHFTFLGYREYELVEDQGETGLKALADSGLGILSGAPQTPYTPLDPKALSLARDPHPLVLTKANSKSTVHRPVYLDYVGVKTYAADGRVTGERRFLGLYTSTAYKQSPRAIPLLRGKVEGVLERAGFPAASHDRKALVEILESYPRDALFQISLDESNY